MIEKTPPPTSDVYARTAMRLRRALGVVGLGLASLGSGPCGACPEPYTECFTFEDLATWHSEYIASFEATCVSGGGGEAGAFTSTTGAVHAAGAPGASTGSNPCYQFDYELLSAWDPNAGCPTEAQLDALDYEHSYVFGERLPRALKQETRPSCCRTVHPDCPGGRPFVIEGEARLPELVLVGDPPTEGSSPVSAALALVWAEDGLAEYASIASFARLTLQLMAFGAPARLIEASQRASLDEHRHAQFCFAEAARHAGRSVEPGVLDIGGSASDSFESFMVLNLIEGCIGETLAGLCIAEQARLAASPALARALAEVSEDETRHAELAFEILRFGLQLNRRATIAAVRSVLEMRLGDEGADLQGGPQGCIPDAVWEAHGRLGANTRRQVRRDGWNLVLAPLLRDLMHDEIASSPDTPRQPPRNATVS